MAKTWAPFFFFCLKESRKIEVYDKEVAKEKKYVEDLHILS